LNAQFIQRTTNEQTILHYSSVEKMNLRGLALLLVAFPAAARVCYKRDILIGGQDVAVREEGHEGAIAQAQYEIDRATELLPETASAEAELRAAQTMKFDVDNSVKKAKAMLIRARLWASDAKQKHAAATLTLAACEAALQGWNAGLHEDIAGAHILDSDSTVMTTSATFRPTTATTLVSAEPNNAATISARLDEAVLQMSLANSKVEASAHNLVRREAQLVEQHELQADAMNDVEDAQASVETAQDALAAVVPTAHEALEETKKKLPSLGQVWWMERELYQADGVLPPDLQLYDHVAAESRDGEREGETRPPEADIPGDCTSLELQDSQIGDIAAQAIAACIKSGANKDLEWLHLGNNFIGDRGARAIAEALVGSQPITTLLLHNNAIGDDGASALADMLKINPTLTELSLYHNAIGDVGASALGHGLRANTVIQYLYVVDNEFGDIGAGSLNAGLKNKKTVTTDICLKDTLQAKLGSMRTADREGFEKKRRSERMFAKSHPLVIYITGNIRPKKGPPVRPRDQVKYPYMVDDWGTAVDLRIAISRHYPELGEPQTFVLRAPTIYFNGANWTTGETTIINPEYGSPSRAKMLAGKISSKMTLSFGKPDSRKLAKMNCEMVGSAALFFGSAWTGERGKKRKVKVKRKRKRKIKVKRVKSLVQNLNYPGGQPQQEALQYLAGAVNVPPHEILQPPLGRAPAGGKNKRRR
jgi:hypothetical protein